MPVLPTPDLLDSAEARPNNRCVHGLCRTGLIPTVRPRAVRQTPLRGVDDSQERALDAPSLLLCGRRRRHRGVEGRCGG